MAKFLFCLPRYHTNVVPWVQILTSAGHQVAIHTISQGVTENYDQLRPTVVKQGRLSGFLKRFRRDHGINDTYAFPGFRAYWALLARENPDVVIIRGVTRWFSRTACLIALLQRRHTVIYDQEDPSPAARSTWARRAIFRLIGVKHVTSRLPVRSYIPGPGCADPLPFGPPPDHGVNTRVLDGSKPLRLLMVAKYRERKGHRALLQALSKISTQQALELTFCGEEAGEADQAVCRSLERLAEQLGIAAQLRFRNNVAHAEMSALYREHDLFILPSRQEPAAVSSIEAAWNKCAVLISRDSGTRGYVPAGDTFDFDPADPDDIARAIRGAVKSPEHLTILRERCYQHISTVAGSDAILKVFERLLR